MASETRQLPRTATSRLSALNTALAKNNALGASSFLTTTTKGRLTAIAATYQARYDLIAVKKHDLAVLTSQKYNYALVSRQLNSHFIQVFNLGVERGVFAKEDRAYYQLDINSSSLPDMSSEALLKQVGNNLITGDAARIAGGGSPMAMPDIAEVTTAYTNFDGLLMPHSAAADAYDTAQENLAASNTEADAVIKKVWDEVETYYNEEEPASQRENAREWGVVYVTRGSNKIISGTVSDSVTNLPIAGASVFLENGNSTVTTAADGSFEINTTLMGEQTLMATSDLHENYSAVISLVENENLEHNIVMIPV